MGWPAVLLSFLLLVPAPVPAQEDDAPPGIPFKEGDRLSFEDLALLEGYVPEPFWEHREYFFFEGMDLKIGPIDYDYSPTEDWKALTAKYAGQARVEADGGLVNYTLGQPFPNIDPSDPQAGAKHAWNMDYRHDALEGRASWYFTYWDGGEMLPLWFKGTGWAMRLSRRSDHADEGGSIFPREKRKGAGGITIDGPPDARGIIGLGYRYLSVDGPVAGRKKDDIWAYIPVLRRVRRLSAAQRTDSIAGTDSTPDDARGFSGLTTDFTWQYVGEGRYLAPINSVLRGYPYSESENFGPYGFSLANDMWELRDVLILEQRPKDSDHIYRRKRLWVDAQTYTVLYAAAYDRRGELWKLMHPASRWSESPLQEVKIEGVRSFLPVCDILVNVRTATGTRTELFDVQATRLRRGKVRKQIDIGRLSREGR